ncbi:MAG TPA: hypothetical protein VF079_10050 [Sphingomicrobium sp.]
MDIRQFRSELAEAFEAAGFQRRAIPRCKDSIWLLPGREVERSFWQNAQRRPWGFVLSGSLAIDVPEFRSWLTKRFPKDQHGIMWSSILGRHIANEPDMFFAVEAEPPPYRQWVDQIRLALAALPDTVDGLLQAEREPQRLRLVWADWDAPKAWRYFKAWAEGHAPDYPPPRMLPTGQIIDVAANDRG